MKYLIPLFFVLMHVNSFSQTQDTLKMDKLETITIRGKIKMRNLSKDGILVKKYLVEGDRDEIEKLKGKRVKITGTFVIIQGVNSRPKKYDRNGDEIIYQGRLRDTKHIKDPKFKVIWFW